MYYGSNSAFLRSVTGRKLTLSSNYVSIRSVYDFSISICYYIPLYHTWHFLICLFEGASWKQTPTTPSWTSLLSHEGISSPPLSCSLFSPPSVHHPHRQHCHLCKCCKNVPKSSSLHCIASIVINILFSGAIILQNQFNADYGSKIPIWSRLSFIECQQSETNLFWIIRLLEFLK